MCVWGGGVAIISGIGLSGLDSDDKELNRVVFQRSCSIK